MKKRLKILKSRWFIYGCLSVIAFFVIVFPNTIKYYARRIIYPARIYSAVKRYREGAETRLLPYYTRASVEYPGEKLIFLVNKDKLTLKLYAGKDFKTIRVIKNYHVLANSGFPGPKLREGDCQIPEGIYKVESLNPNSRYHLSLKLNYPNPFDLKMAKQDRRTKIGYDIFIHGKNVSIGCVAIGDPSIEELFVLTALVGKENVKVIIIPNNFKDKTKIDTILKRTPQWTKELYQKLQKEVEKIK